MQIENFSIDSFTKILIECLNDITNHMKSHPGILHVMRSRFKFEKWFQVELLGRLIEKTSTNTEISWHNEIAVNTKVSKKGPTIDLAIKKNGEKFVGIELKIIPTSYRMEGFDTKTKAMPEGVYGLINDLKKCCDDGYPYQISIGFVFPLPIDLTHRNHIDFEKQIGRLNKCGNLRFIESRLSDKFISRFYLLSNFKIA